MGVRRSEGDGERPGDNELCERVRSAPGSPEGKAAYAELYDRYRTAALVRAYRATGDPSSAEEVVAEAFTKTLQALHRGFGPTESFAAYLFTAVRGEASRRSPIDALTETVDETTLSLLPESVIDDTTAQYSESDQLLRAFSGLSVERQRIVWLIEVEGLSREQVAAQLEMSVPAATSMLARAREELRTAYLQQHVESMLPSCRDSARHLSALVRGSLSKRVAEKTQAHLRGCAECSAQLHTLRNLNGRLRAALAPLAAAGGSSAAVLADSSPAAASLEKTVRKPWLRLVGVGGFCLMLAGLFLLFDPHDSPQPVDRGRAVTAHEPQADADSVEAGNDGAATGVARDRDTKAGSVSDRPGREIPPKDSQDDRTRNWVVTRDLHEHRR